MFNKKKESTHSYCQIEIVSLIVYLIAIFWGLAMLYRSVLFSEITRERVVDSLLSVVSLMFILLLHKFNNNLQSTIGKKYCCLVQAFLYFCAIIQGDKYIMCLIAIVYLFTLLLGIESENLLMELMGIVALLEIASLWFLLRNIPSNNIVDRLINGWIVDVVFVLITILYELRDRLQSILNNIMQSIIFKILVFIAMVVLTLFWVWILYQTKQWIAIIQLAREHPKKIAVILIITIIYMLRPWKLKKLITCRVLDKKKFCVFICVIAGCLCIGLSYGEQLLANSYAEKHGYSCQYGIEDYFNGNIQPQGFELSDDGTLISQNNDPWIIVNRKAGYNSTIYNVVLEFEKLSNEGENGYFYVFSDENNWDAEHQTGTYICQKGQVIIVNDALKDVQNYLRLDLTQQEGAVIKLTKITFNDCSEQIGCIKYVGFILLIIGFVLWISSGKKSTI